MRVVIADDEVLLRQGLSRLLETTHAQVVASVGDARALGQAVAEYEPDAVIVDIKMPPSHTDEGIVAALDIRSRYPSVAVLVLSHYLDSRYALRLLEHQERSVGYLLKERVSDLAVLVDALQRITEGECVVDPTIVSRLMSRRSRSGPIERLSPREQEVLSLMAQGHSNARICEQLVLSPRTVEAHVAHIFAKLALTDSAESHHRVQAVLMYLRRSHPSIT